MTCAVTITAQQEQVLEAEVKIALVDGAGVAENAVCVNRVSDSFIEIRAIRGATSTGLLVEQKGNVGTFNNFWRIGSIRHNGGNGLLIISPASGHLGVQGNHFQVGQVIFNKHSGMAVFGAESSWNYFQVGPLEHNGYFGCYSEGRVNKWLIVDSNSNGLADNCGK